MRAETEDALRQERERYRSGVESLRGQLELEQDERRRVQSVASKVRPFFLFAAIHLALILRLWGLILLLCPRRLRGSR